MEFPIQPNQPAANAETAAPRRDHLRLEDVVTRPFVLTICLIILSGFVCSLARLAQTAGLVNGSQEEVPVLCGGISTGLFIDSQPATISVALLMQAMSRTLASRHFEGDPLSSCQARDLFSGLSQESASKIYGGVLFVSCVGVLTMLLARPFCWDLVFTKRCPKSAFRWIIVGGIISTILEAVALWLATKRQVKGLTATSVLIL